MKSIINLNLLSIFCMVMVVNQLHGVHHPENPLEQFKFSRELEFNEQEIPDVEKLFPDVERLFDVIEDGCSYEDEKTVFVNVAHDQKFEGNKKNYPHEFDEQAAMYHRLYLGEEKIPKLTKKGFLSARSAAITRKYYGLLDHARRIKKPINPIWLTVLPMMVLSREEQEMKKSYKNHKIRKKKNKIRSNKKK